MEDPRRDRLKQLARAQLAVVGPDPDRERQLARKRHARELGATLARLLRTPHDSPERAVRYREYSDAFRAAVPCARRLADRLRVVG